ncbi:OsmC family protein [Microbulbifer sp. OS29]|uniref:OsmC family protein n=1 Tax=Microbulbifer okhotskensis TaxID=2926617 RepID=A0A9X2EKM7_9GAMM|nr:OsmC-related (seleno)protein [Microbulbifer okhotskensis]MCO1333977.1 OsmC family protein [Microbulbifer okhotskensis]
MSDTGKKAEDVTIVRKVSALPALSKIKVEEPWRDEGSFHFQVNLSAENSPNGGFLKIGTVQANVPGCGAFELRCDEGSVIGGTDNAPAPLDYLSAGIAFCFLSHISFYINTAKLKVKNVRLEQQVRFKAEIDNMQSPEDQEPRKGVCEGIDTFVYVQSEEPRDIIEQMVTACRAACMGFQLAINAVPTEMTLIYNEP